MIYHYAPQDDEKARAEDLADQTLSLYTTAANYIYDQLDGRSGPIKGRWWDGERELPGLFEAEREERRNMPQLFGWPREEAG